MDDFDYEQIVDTPPQLSKEENERLQKENKARNNARNYQRRKMASKKEKTTEPKPPPLTITQTTKAEAPALSTMVPRPTRNEEVNEEPPSPVQTPATNTSRTMASRPTLFPSPARANTVRASQRLAASVERLRNKRADRLQREDKLISRYMENSQKDYDLYENEEAQMLLAENLEEGLDPQQALLLAGIVPGTEKGDTIMQSIMPPVMEEESEPHSLQRLLMETEKQSEMPPANEKENQPVVQKGSGNEANADVGAALSRTPAGEKTTRNTVSGSLSTIRNKRTPKSVASLPSGSSPANQNKRTPNSTSFLSSSTMNKRAKTSNETPSYMRTTSASRRGRATPDSASSSLVPGSGKTPQSRHGASGTPQSVTVVASTKKSNLTPPTARSSPRVAVSSKRGTTPSRG